MNSSKLVVIGTKSLPVIFFDGEKEQQVGVIGVNPLLANFSIFREQVAAMVKKKKPSPSSLLMYAGGKGGARIPLRSEKDFKILEGETEFSLYVMVKSSRTNPVEDKIRVFFGDIMVDVNTPPDNATPAVNGFLLAPNHPERNLDGASSSHVNLDKQSPTKDTETSEKSHKPTGSRTKKNKWRMVSSVSCTDGQTMDLHQPTPEPYIDSFFVGRLLVPLEPAEVGHDSVAVEPGTTTKNRDSNMASSSTNIDSCPLDDGTKFKISFLGEQSPTEEDTETSVIFTDGDGSPVEPTAESIEVGDGSPMEPNAKSIEVGDGSHVQPNAESIEVGVGSPVEQNAKSIEVGDGSPVEPNAKSGEVGDGSPNAKSIEVGVGSPVEQNVEPGKGTNSGDASSSAHNAGLFSEVYSPENGYVMVKESYLAELQASLRQSGEATVVLQQKLGKLIMMFAHGMEEQRRTSPIELGTTTKNPDSSTTSSYTHNDWSPLDDGIEIACASSNDPTSVQDVNAHIESVLYSPHNYGLYSEEYSPENRYVVVKESHIAELQARLRQYGEVIDKLQQQLSEFKMMLAHGMEEQSWTSPN